MKTSLTKWCLSVCLLFFIQTVYAQQVSVKGVITAKSDGYPVIGASIVQTGTTNGIVSDLDGKFTLDVPAGTSSVNLPSRSDTIPFVVPVCTIEAPITGYPSDLAVITPFTDTCCA